MAYVSISMLACRSPAMPERAAEDDAGLRELGELPADFPTGWFETDDGRLMKLPPSQDGFAFLDGRDVKPRFLHAPFAPTDAGAAWTASAAEFMSCDLEEGQGASLVTERIDLAPLEGGGWRLETRVVAARPCERLQPEVVVTSLHTSHVLTPIGDPVRARALDATLAAAGAADACPKLARCCRAVRRHAVAGAVLDLCARMPVFPVECHDLRAQLAEVVDAGACRR